MKRQHPSAITAPTDFRGPLEQSDDGTHFFTPVILSATEEERRSRFSVSWAEQQDSAPRNVHPDVVAYQDRRRKFRSEIADRLLWLFKMYGIELNGEEPQPSDWQRLCILQAVNSGELNVKVDGASLPFKASSEDILAVESIQEAVGKRYAAHRHELIREVMRQFILVSKAKSRSGAASKTEAAKSTVSVLKDLFPGEYADADYKSIRANHNAAESETETPVGDAIAAYFYNVLCTYDEIERVAGSLTGYGRT